MLIVALLAAVLPALLVALLSDACTLPVECGNVASSVLCDGRPEAGRKKGGAAWSKRAS